MTIIAVANEKGGIGKTTISFNMAKFLAKKRKKILVIENDTQGNITRAFTKDKEAHAENAFKLYQGEDVEPINVAKNIDLVGSGKPLGKISEGDFDIVWRIKEYLEERKNGYDYVIIDCLPGLGPKLVAALNAADYVLIPTKTALFGMMGLSDLLEEITKAQKRMNPNLEIAGIVLNHVERKTVIHSELEEAIREEYGSHIRVYKNVIPKAIKIEESPVFCKSIMEHAPKSKEAKQFINFFNEFFKGIK